MMTKEQLNATGRGDYHSLYKGQSVDDLIIQYMQDNNVPGMALAIVQAPYITRVVGYGLADRETKRLVASNTVFNVGQLSNAYTAVAILQLKEEGKLKLEDSMTAYFSDLPEAWSAITIRHLISHSSGLPSYSDESFDFSKDYSLTDFIQLLGKKPLLFSPGSKMNPSATDHYLLGKIIEKASGISYQDYVTKNQIERMGLKHTFFVSNMTTVQNEVNNGSTPFKHQQFLQNPVFVNPTEPARGYVDKDGSLAPSAQLTWSATYADSGIVASAEDISLWDIGLAGGILLKDPENRNFIYNPTTLNDGEMIPGNGGWFFPGHKGLMEIKGNIPGYSSFLSRFTDASELVCVTLLANKDNLLDLDILGRKIAAAFDPKLGAVLQGAAWSETLQSPYAVSKTLERVKTIIQAQGGTIFAHISHSAEAKKVGEKLPNTEVLIVGNPAKGTLLMQTNPAFALDLPLRIMATEDSFGQVWLSFTEPVRLAEEYNISEEELPRLRQLSSALRKLCEKAISPLTMG
ncbi:serine hydrolase [Legionella feeleii]|nr:serine hydrolase [Legionella feeleii]